MYLDQLRQKRGLSVYELAKRSGVAYSTLNDLCKEKTKLNKANAETLWSLSHALQVSMEDLLAPYVEKRADFENFKSAVCHRLKRLGDKAFIIQTLELDEIRKFYNWNWYPECLYLLAMLDYISRINDVALCSDYDDLRNLQLAEPIYPQSLLISANYMEEDELLQQAFAEAIPEFRRFNIVENEVSSVA